MSGPELDSPLGSRTRVAYETARLRLVRLHLENARSRSLASRRAVQISAAALNVARVGIWLFNTDGTAIECVDEYSLSSGAHVAGARLEAGRYPAYFAALQERRAIVAHDARTDPITRELTESYLDPLGITSLLDAPILRGGRVIGVVCHEHVGPAREWTQSDMAFSSSVADMLTIIFEQGDRLELEARARRDAEERASHLKMEALGRLAAAVAHDFNNTLSVVGLLAQDLTRHADPSVAHRGAEMAEDLAVAMRLARQLLTFGRDRAAAVAEIRLDELLARLRPMLTVAVGPGVPLTISVTSRCPEVTADASLIEQIVLNLCFNARDAVGDGGRIDIVVRDPLPADELDEGRVLLEVSDDGAGMDEATQARMFEPYFTTKPQGTGLGLATVYGIVTQLGGQVRVRSEPGVGTTITAALPRTASG